MEEFSDYLVSPLRRRYDVFFRSTMVAFKAVQCWLRLKLSDKAPQNWADKRKKMDDRIANLTRGPNKEATIEEVSENEEEEYKIENDRPTTIKNLGRMEIGSRSKDIKKVIEYNILKRKKNENIQNWKSYPGNSKIIDIARDVVEREIILVILLT